MVPEGDYTITARGVDQHDQVTTTPTVRHAKVTHPAGNAAPVAKFTYVCPPSGQPTASKNICEFDGRTSTDENAATLSYAWTYTLNGVNSTTTGPKPIRTFTAPGTYTVQLIVTDEWGTPSAATTQQVTITEPSGNLAPTPVINPPACNGLVCNFSGVGSADPNPGDTFSYNWDFGDLTFSTSTSPSHTFAQSGTYTVKLTTTDGWGKAASTTRTVTVP